MTVLDELPALGWPHVLISLEEWDALPVDTETRVECVEGMVVMMAPADNHHQRAMARLLMALTAVLPPELGVLTEVGVILEDDPPTIRTPDLSVVPFLDEQRKLFRADEVGLVIEIVSPGSRRIDRVAKLSEYADAGLPEYWVLDRDDLVLSTYLLGADGRYLLTGEHDGVATVQTRGVTVTVDVAGLIRR